MKQGIFIEQLEQLTEKEKQVLKEYSKTFVSELEYHETGVRIWEAAGGQSGAYYQGLPLLNIGQMIEFIEQDTDIFLHIYWDWPWIVCLEKHDAENNHKDFRGEELCDCLWEAVKYILRK